MKKFQKQALWTILEIWIYDEKIEKKHIENIYKIVEIFENKYSRFKKWNYLWELNKNKTAEINEDFKTILNIAKKANELSKWYFDITVLPFLENIWYWISEKKITENFWMENIIIKENKIYLENNVQIEIWWIWKWYMVDVIFDNLKKNYNNFIINFGWDIRLSWEKEFLLEDPIDNKKYIWKIKIKDLALASSGINKRKTNKWHHLIDIKKQKPENEKLWIYVTHKLASLADTFATTLFVSPINISLEILNKIDWLEAMIIMKNGEIFKSKNFNIIELTKNKNL